MADSISQNAARYRELVANGRWAIQTVWRTSPYPAGGMLALLVLRSGVPAGLALVARGLVNAAVGAMQAGATTLGPLAPWLAMGLVLALIEALGSISHKLLVHRLSSDLNLKITSDILEHAAHLDLSFFEDPRMQDMITRAQGDSASRLLQFYTHSQQALMFLIQTISLVGILVILEPLVLLVVGPIAAPYMVFQWRLSKKRYQTVYDRTEKRRWTSYFMGRFTSAVAATESKLLDLAPLLIPKFQKLMREFREQDRKIHLREFTGSALFAAIATVAFYAVFVRVALRALSGALTIGDLAIFAGATTRLRSMLDNGIRAGTSAAEQSLYVANLRAFLAVRPRVEAGPGLVPSSCEGEIRVENVSFRYPGSEEWVLRGVSLTIAPGETLGIVGENGAGKTTLAKLLARLYDPDDGQILLDGVPLPELSLEYLHSRIGFMAQGAGRFEATAADNIAYGNWRELIEKREQLERIARLANVDSLIEAMPDGYDTMLGRAFGHYNLSSGQWQRIAMARTLARDASILILDEPSSNLDARAESELLETLSRLASKCTTVLISHRFSTMGIADRVVMMDRGMVVESGTHEELLAKRGHYARLFELHERHRLRVRPNGEEAAS